MANDFLLCVGGAYYTEESFKAEAARLGVSRRVRGIPEGLVPGESRVYCVFGAERTGYRCTCTSTENEAQLRCGGHCTVDKDSTPRVSICEQCGTSYPATKPANPGRVVGYFVPDVAEVVLKVTEERAREILNLSHSWLHTTWEESDDTMRARVRITGEVSKEILDGLRAEGGVLMEAADIFAAARPGEVEVVFVVREARRGCGYRHHRGAYIVRTNRESPFVEINPPPPYEGEHFRSLHRLSEEEMIHYHF